MISYAIQTTVAKIEHKIEAVRSVATGKKDDQGKMIYKTEQKDFGWFVLFEGSHEYIFLGHEKPEVFEGQQVEIVLRFK